LVHSNICYKPVIVQPAITNLPSENFNVPGFDAQKLNLKIKNHPPTTKAFCPFVHQKKRKSYDFSHQQNKDPK
jgi:hypothetical protein